MSNFWEESFKQKKEMWGAEACHSANLTAELFSKNGLVNILIPGIGYGRNAQPFLEKGMNITGIEISESAITMASKYLGDKATIYHGSVNTMPYDSQIYDGIYSHALLHLLDHPTRLQFLKNCFEQLSPNGLMVFTTISKRAPTYQQGVRLEKNRYEIHKGAPIYFYDEETIKNDFSSYGRLEITEIQEDQLMYLIMCQKA